MVSFELSKEIEKDVFSLSNAFLPFMVANLRFQPSC